MSAHIYWHSLKISPPKLYLFTEALNIWSQHNSTCMQVHAHVHTSHDELQTSMARHYTYHKRSRHSSQYECGNGHKGAGDFRQAYMEATAVDHLSPWHCSYGLSWSSSCSLGAAEADTFGCLKKTHWGRKAARSFCGARLNFTPAFFAGFQGSFIVLDLQHLSAITERMKCVARLWNNATHKRKLTGPFAVARHALETLPVIIIYPHENVIHPPPT